VRHFGFLWVLQDPKTTISKTIDKNLNGKDFITTIFTPAKINPKLMGENIDQIIILILSIAGWIFSSFPTLRYIIYLTEGDFRWQIIPWYLLLTASIFGMKFSLFVLTGWPAPGSWSSRLFYLIFLFGAYMLPFIREYLKSWIGRSKK
jgi:hypothetical protein